MLCDDLLTRSCRSFETRRGCALEITYERTVLCDHRKRRREERHRDERDRQSMAEGHAMPNARVGVTRPIRLVVGRSRRGLGRSFLLIRIHTSLFGWPQADLDRRATGWVHARCMSVACGLAEK